MNAVMTGLTTLKNELETLKAIVPKIDELNKKADTVGTICG